MSSGPSTPSSVSPPGTDATGAGARERSPWRLTFYLVTVAVVAWAAVLVPLPYVEYLPGTPTPIPPLIEIEGTPTTELEGETALLTVLLRQQPAFQALRAALSDQRRLMDAASVFPPDEDRDAFFAHQREVFGRQFEVATVIGAEAAGVETTLVSEPVVVSVAPGSAAEGVLEPGDVILSIDGEDVVSGEEVQARTQAGEVGDVLQLELRRDGEPLTTSVRLGELPGVDYPVMGVTIETAVHDIELPFEVELSEDTRIGGPSAGMMVAVTVYDLLSDEDLLQDRLVLGTGTVDADGRIGPVGGVPEKMLAAAEYGAEVVLVPASQLDEAMTTAPDHLTVFGVATIDEAIEVLRDSAA